MKTKQINYKLVIELSICGLLLVVGILFVLFVRPKTPKSKPREYNYNELILVENLEFELNSELNIYDLIDPENKLEIVTENELIDTSVMGVQGVTIQYRLGALTDSKTFEITITDKTGPIITYNNELTTIVNKEIDLMRGVSAVDNSNAPIEVTIDGNYDFSRAGKYYLQYVAVDPSGNKTVEKFTLIVNRNTTVTTKKTTTKKTSASQVENPNSNESTTEKTNEKPSEEPSTTTHKPENSNDSNESNNED